MSETEIVFPTPDQIIDEVSGAPRINDGVLSFGEDRIVMDDPGFNPDSEGAQQIRQTLRRRASVAEQLGIAPVEIISAPSKLEFPDVQQTADNVEYEVQMPGGGTETYDTTAPGGNTPIVDPMLLAKRKLAQLRMLRRIMKMMKRRKKLKEARGNKVSKSRKKRDQQKQSRKKNR